jgi:nicotinate-nucleotide adenylyltransferase
MVSNLPKARVAELRSQRWGILGGIFDPIHNGHLAIAEQTADELALAGVLFIPAGQPVHRDPPAASAADRLTMVQLATADNARFLVSSMELEADRPSYSVETMEDLHAEHPEDEFVLIMSAESAAALPSWRDPMRLLELAEIAIVPRLGYDAISRDWINDLFPGRHDRFHLLDTSHLGNSATDVRERVAEGKSIRYLVPAAVEAYIAAHNLYSNQGDDWHS